MARAQSIHEASRKRLVASCSQVALALAMGILLNACGGGGDVDSEELSAISCASGPSPAVLTWNPVTDPDLDGYHVYYGTTSGAYPLGPVDIPSNLATVTVPGLSSGETYYFVVVAYDTSGNESGYSNVVCKTIT